MNHIHKYVNPLRRYAVNETEQATATRWQERARRVTALQRRRRCRGRENPRAEGIGHVAGKGSSLRHV
eukprot:6199412-Pleurochrysis_carterae.AAC.3